MMTAAEVLAERARRPKVPVDTPAEALNKILRKWARYGAGALNTTWSEMICTPNKYLVFTYKDLCSAESYGGLVPDYITEMLMVHVAITPDRLILTSEERSAHLTEWLGVKEYLQTHAETAGFTVQLCPSGQSITVRLPPCGAKDPGE
jgi:hypothetical protein